MYWTEVRNCARKSPEKDEVKEGQWHPRPAGPMALGRPAWPLFKPPGAPLSQVCSSLNSLFMFFKFFTQKHKLELWKFRLPKSTPKISENSPQILVCSTLRYIVLPPAKKTPWCVCFWVCAAKSHHEWLHEVRHQEEKDVFINIRCIGKFFAEALGRRVSAGHGGRQPHTEERHVTPWWDERPKKFLHEIHRRHATSNYHSTLPHLKLIKLNILGSTKRYHQPL